MAQFEIAEAAMSLPALVERAQAGEDVVLSEGGRAVARLVASPPDDRSGRERVLGRLEGQFRVPDDFDAPLPDDLLMLFYEGPIFPDDPPVESTDRDEDSSRS